MRPLLLDLFCGAGGAAMGYHRAGFDVVGVDINPQSHYPFAFYRGDATNPSNWLEATNGRTPDAIHASPPCQSYSSLRGFTDGSYPRLIDPVRHLLRMSGLPYVIENVVGAPLADPVRLCGSSFDLLVWRHRLFETSPALLFPPSCSHADHPNPIDVTGTGGPFMGVRKSPGGGVSRKPRNLAHAREAMGIDWMTRKELSESIPPAYTEWVGAQLIAALRP